MAHEILLKLIVIELAARKGNPSDAKAHLERMKSTALEMVEKADLGSGPAAPGRRAELKLTIEQLFDGIRF